MQYRFFAKNILGVLVTLVSVFGVGLFVASAQDAPLDAARRAQLESDLAGLEKEIAAQQAILTAKQREGVSLERDIAILNAQIEKSKLSIKARTLSINKLVSEIGVKNTTIVKYSAKIDRERDSLAALLRRTNELDTYSIAAVALSDKPLSEFFGDLDAFQSVEDAISQSVTEVGVAKKETEVEKATLEDKKAKEQDLKHAQELEKTFLAAREAEKRKILKATKGQEVAYQKILKDKQSKAASIRAELFALRDTGEIPFGTAYDYAKLVSQKTGVRPAFLLAIFMQESGFGKNQGSCYLKDAATGAGVSSRTGNIIQRVMKPGRDVSPFMTITENVGRDPFNTLVSCPQEVGYGGAMGPAQFIPSTWVLYEDLITKALGITAADPWRARDAFMAAGFLLKDNGAKSTSYSAERNAACQYFSGKVCSKSPWAATYGTQVMKKADTIQTTMIDPLENS